MQKGPIVDAEFEVVADPHPSAEELADRDRRIAAVQAELHRTNLKGWRLWGAVVLTLAIAWPVTTAFFWIAHVVFGPVATGFSGFMASLGAP